MRPRTAAASSLPAFLRLPASYPDRYVWYILVCFLDLIITNTIISRFGGIEVNGLAARVIDSGGFFALIAFKVALMLIVIAICETIARSNRRAGERLAEWAVALSSVPVVIGLLQIALVGHHHRVDPQPDAVLVCMISGAP